MTIDEAQKQVDEWIKTVGVRYFSELTNMACLTEEVGELARVPPLRRPVFQGRRKLQPGRRDGRRTLGTDLPGQPDGREPDGGTPEKYREENPKRQRTTY